MKIDRGVRDDRAYPGLSHRLEPHNRVCSDNVTVKQQPSRKYGFFSPILLHDQEDDPKYNRGYGKENRDWRLQGHIATP